MRIQNLFLFTKIRKPRYFDNPGIFRTLTYLKPYTYSEPSERFKMECFEKIVKSYNHF